MAEPVPALDLGPLTALLPLGEPFTPAMAAAVGIGRSALRRLLCEGQVRKLLRGVYVEATVVDCVQLRARSLALLVRDQVVVDRTAAWLHGVDLGGTAPERVEALGASRPSRGRRPALADRDVESIGPLRVSTPLRTALDLGARLAPERALAALDGLLGTRRFSHAQLIAELDRFAGQDGVGRLRQLAAMADSRAMDACESALRLRWYAARLPTPIPGLVLGGVRLALGLPVQRFGAVMAGPGNDAGLCGPGGPGARGWRIVVLPRARVLGGDPHFVIGHLEREFRRHLLAQAG